MILVCVRLFIVVILALLISGNEGRLIFPPNSDVGYIVKDSDADGDVLSLTDKNILGDFWTDSFKKRKIKREFWHPQENEIEYVEKDKNLQYIPKGLEDSKHGVVMGVSDDRCDNGEKNVSIDWDGSPINHTCYTPKKRLNIRHDLKPILHCDQIEDDYSPKHFCMGERLVYNESLPTFGDHRPLWPVYGEYTFVPIQRWLHSIEHGAVVMLYHPCTHPLLVQQLKTVVKRCIYKHVITPYTLVSIDRPLVLIAWGCRLELSHVDETVVKNFIKDRALHGPEGDISKQGMFYIGLKDASIPLEGSDYDDSILCP